MLSKFHKYVESSNTQSPEESLDELEQLLIEDQKKSPNQREINSTKCSDYSFFNRQKITPLQFALMRTAFNNTPRLKKIIELYIKYSDLTVEGDYGTALHYACCYTRCGKQVIKALVDKNPELIAKECITNCGGSYPIIGLANYDRDGECLQVLIDAGADVNIKATKTGWTALHQAAYVNNETAVSILLTHGANKNARNKEGCLPTQEACYWQTDKEQLCRHAEIIALIRNFKQDKSPAIQTNSGLNP
ncbi:Ankyrin repeat protein [Legionella cherrii]|uniref:Ankyrin repeat protein n=1 Tax=Legionella cherrii TaxID=28084 RepID=A0A0W0SFL2_9GAMM|nr:ankyrin repeat domain-containing protein [Legionella cherrii]KTC82222.1 Ankyrin repeat protein [Legionella cherrii]